MNRGPQAGVPLVELTRRDVRDGSEVVESLHHGHLVAVDGDGTVTREDGDAALVVFPRSALKPLQALLCLEILDAAGLQLAPSEVAIGWASHRAAPDQLAAVHALLARAGLGADALRCPPASAPEAPDGTRSPLLHNCSGKHALFAVTAHALGSPGDRETLLAHDGPLQARLIAGLDELVGPVTAIGVDGCGAPALAVPLVAVARAFVLLATDARFARIRAAGLAHPGLIGGYEQGPDGTPLSLVDTELLGAGVVAKRGAEGFLAAGWNTPDGRAGGLAAKASDGSMRGVAPAVLAHLEAAGVVPVGTWREPAPQGGGRTAGTIRAVRTRDEGPDASGRSSGGG